MRIGGGYAAPERTVDRNRRGFGGSLWVEQPKHAAWRRFFLFLYVHALDKERKVVLDYRTYDFVLGGRRWRHLSFDRLHRINGIFAEMVRSTISGASARAVGTARCACCMRSMMAAEAARLRRSAGSPGSASRRSTPPCASSSARGRYIWNAPAGGRSAPVPDGGGARRSRREPSRGCMRRRARPSRTGRRKRFARTFAIWKAISMRSGHRLRACSRGRTKDNENCSDSAIGSLYLWTTAALHAALHHDDDLYLHLQRGGWLFSVCREPGLRIRIDRVSRQTEGRPNGRPFQRFFRLALKNMAKIVKKDRKIMQEKQDTERINRMWVRMRILS